MKSFLAPAVLLSLLVLSPAIAQEAKKEAPAAKQPAAKQQPAPEGLKTHQEQASYAIGLDIGRNMARSGLDELGITPELVARGIRDAFEGKESALTDEQVQAAMVTLQQQLAAMQQQKQKKEEEERKAAAKTNIQLGKEFLAKNAKREEVKVTDSGLQYEVIKEGDGPSPEATDTVVAHYHGMLIDGQVFDSSIQRGEPLEIPVNRVIPGWTEALQKMKVGSKWRLYVPPELGYGERGSGAVIGPNSTLIFTVELLGIK